MNNKTQRIEKKYEVFLSSILFSTKNKESSLITRLSSTKIINKMMKKLKKSFLVEDRSNLSS